jgi:hypothetical protein
VSAKIKLQAIATTAALALFVIPGLLLPMRAEGPNSWSMSNGWVKIALSAESKGGLSEFVDLTTGRNLIGTSSPLYRILLSQRGKDLVEVSSLDASDVSAKQEPSKDGQEITLIFTHHRPLEITVTCRVALPSGSNLSQWQISVKNETAYGVRAIQYPVVRAPLRLAGAGDHDHFVWGIWGGRIHDDPGKHLPQERQAAFRADGGTGRNSSDDTLTHEHVSFLPDQYPGPVSEQFQAYYDRAVGLYMAAHDGHGNIKHFGITRLADSLDISIEHNYDERPGLTFTLPYETVLGVFHGDWQTAADIYKEWAGKQYWTVKKLTERDDIPSWLKEPRPMLEFEIRGHYERVRGTPSFPPSDFPDGRFYPAKKVVSLSERYASLFDTPVTVWYNGWEKIGNPCGPADIFPPLEGEQSFKAAMADVTRDGYYPSMAFWGMHWCYKRSSGGYDDWQRFMKEGLPLAALNDKEEPSRFVIGNMEKLFVPLCVGSDKTQQVFHAWEDKLMDLGAVSLEFDHQIGAYPSVCYSDQHGHPPGYGPWMYDKMRQFLQTSRDAAKHRNPNAVFSHEGICEAWVPYVDFMLNRPYSTLIDGSGSLPIFTYLYHEYIPLVGGDGNNGLSRMDVESMQQAANFIVGNQAFVMIGLSDYDFGVNPDYPIFMLQKNMSQARRGFAHDYLTFGKMLKKPDLETSTVTVDAWVFPGKETVSPPTAEVPKVMASAWLSPQGKTGEVLINWTENSEKVVLTLIKKQRPTFLVVGSDRKALPQDEVNAGKVTFALAPGSIALVEQE